MTFTIKGYKLKIIFNENNKLSSGMYNNILQLKENNEWYNCSYQISNTYIQISKLYTTDMYNKMTIYKEDINYIIKISPVINFFIEVFLNRHNLNRKVYKIRKQIHNRRYSIYVFSIAFLLSLSYYLGNEFYNGKWAFYITHNSIIQSFLMLLTIFSIGSVFYPFTITKPLNKIDIKDIANEEIIRYFDKLKEDEKFDKMSRI